MLTIARVSKIAFLIILFLALIYAASGLTPFGSTRPLGEFYLKNAYNHNQKTLWAASPEVVSALLWDYRGFDTVLETAVFYLGAIGVLSLLRLRAPVKEEVGRGMSIIVKATGKIVFIFIITASLTITVLGKESPGGGFQGGSIYSIAYVLFLVAFSRQFLEKKVLLKNLLAIQAIGLLLITITSMTGFLGSWASGETMYIHQNQPKDWAPMGFPAILAGSITLLEIGEMLNVAMGFILIFLALTLSEKTAKMGSGNG